MANHTAESKNAWQPRAIDLLEQGASRRKIAEILEAEGYPGAKKSTVGDFLKKRKGMEVAQDNVPLDFSGVYSGKPAEA